jgi:hypothetical protein
VGRKQQFGTDLNFRNPAKLCETLIQLLVLVPLHPEIQTAEHWAKNKFMEVLTSGASVLNRKLVLDG